MDSLLLSLSTLIPSHFLAPKPHASLSFTLSCSKPFFKSTISANPLQHPLTLNPLCPSNPSGAAALRRSAVWSRKDLPIQDNECLATATYDIVFYSDSIHTTVTNDPDVAAQWISDIRSTHSPVLTIGLDIEWLPNRGAHRNNPVATLQLCLDRWCLIFQLLHAPLIPEALVEFLANPNHTFVRVGVAQDVEKLKKDHDFGFGTKTVDLCGLPAEKYDQPELKRAGLKRLAKIVLDKDMKKDPEVTLSEWDDKQISPIQVSYACVDAFVSYEIARRLC